jgi:hypothetical protein
VFVAGDTQSTDFPVTAEAAQKTFAGGLSDGFLVRLNASDLAALTPLTLAARATIPFSP